MTDYTKPPVTDETALSLAKSINDFTDKTTADIQNLTEIVQTELNKRYYVNHEPHVELPLESEYNYTCDLINDSLANRVLNDYPHFFISGYLPSGEKIQFNPYSADQNTVDNYSAVYINGNKVDLSVRQEYVCQAEAGGWEKLNLMFISTMGNTPKLVVEYSDMPLKKFDLIVYDETSKRANIDVSSFIGSMEIGSLKYIGDLTWSYYGASTLRSLEVTGDVNVTGEMMCTSLSTLIIPNATNVPNTNTLAESKNNLWDIDISNVKDTVGYLQYVNFGALTLICKKIGASGLIGAYIDTLDTGDECTTIGNHALTDSLVRKVRMGKSTTTVGERAVHNNAQLQSVSIDSDREVQIGYEAITLNNHLETISFSPNLVGLFGNFCLRRNTALQEINFGRIASMTVNACDEDVALKNLTVVPNGITATAFSVRDSPYLTEQSCLNIVNGLSDTSATSVYLHTTIKNKMGSEWYCKLGDNMLYVSCKADDEGAMLQTEALIAKGGSLF